MISRNAIPNARPQSENFRRRTLSRLFRTSYYRREPCMYGLSISNALGKTRQSVRTEPAYFGSEELLLISGTESARVLWRPVGLSQAGTAAIDRRSRLFMCGGLRA